MKLINQSFEILTPIDANQILSDLELFGRVCYKSEAAINECSAKRFVANLIKHGHESVLEHRLISVRFITDRGVTHEVVRHRVGSYSQESTRYCSYAGDVTFIPTEHLLKSKHKHKMLLLLKDIENFYHELIESGIKPQDARDILPNCLKTEIVVTYNLREWRHYFKLRTSKTAHPKIRELSINLLNEFKKQLPVVFDDIEVE